MNLTQTERTSRLKLLTEIAHSGIEWLHGYSEKEIQTGLEVIAHQIASSLCQWFHLTYVGTSETLNFLDLNIEMKETALHRRLVRYVRELEKDEKMMNVS